MKLCLHVPSEGNVSNSSSFVVSLLPFIHSLLCPSLLLLRSFFPPGSEGKEFHPLQDRGEHQEEGAGVQQGVQTQRCSAAAHRQQQEERGTSQHAGRDMVKFHMKKQTKHLKRLLIGHYFG